MPPKSKRQRKQKDKFSLKIKSGKTTDAGVEFPEDDSNAFILPAKTDTSSKDVEMQPAEANATAPPTKHLSKSQQRKLRKVTEEKERREKRAEVYQQLSQHQMAQDQLQLLRSITDRGQKDTKRKAAKRALQLQRAGVELPEDTALYRKRGKPSKDEEDDEDSSSEEEDDNDLIAAAKQTASGRTNQLPAAKRAKTAHIHGNQPPPSTIHTNKPSFSSETAANMDISALTEQQRLTLRESVEAAKAEIELNNEDDGTGLHKHESNQEGEEDAAVLAGRQPVVQGPARVVYIERTPEINEARSGLPIIGMEQEIMESITKYDIVVLCGETGCGKTTQVPQFLLEAGYGSRLFPEREGAIGVTQPRRVAAASTAARVAEELGSAMGDTVGYQVRYDRKVGKNTAIKFMTDGILLRELREDFLLRRYSVIIVDEAHERSLNTDILLGMLSRIVALRRSMAQGGSTTSGSTKKKDDSATVYPLKLLVMSATLRIEDFVENRRLFPTKPPVVNVPARQYPVTVHFSKKTELHDYIGAAYKKTCQIHKTLPPGGILIFVTGQREIEHLCRKLRKTFSQNNKTQKLEEIPTLDNNDLNSNEGADAVDAYGEDAAELALSDDQDDYTDNDDDDEDMDGDKEPGSDSDGDEEEVVVMGGDGLSPEEITAAEKRFEQQYTSSSHKPLDSKNREMDDDDNDDEAIIGPVHVLPLYAMLPSSLQARVFKPPPPGHRLIIVATNAAETSITIPGIRYVVDAGRSKQRLLEQASGLARFEVRWVSKASGEQRAGRAGRTGPGHCYRLYSSAIYNDLFPQHTPPEIVNTALEGVVLSLKSLGVERVVNFPFPTAPEMQALIAAERCLIALSAVDSTTNKLTELGVKMSAYPIGPRHARMLLEVATKHQYQQQQCAHQDDNVERRESSTSSNKKKKKKNKATNTSSSSLDVLRYAVGLAAALSVESPFVHVDGDDLQQEKPVSDNDDDNSGEDSQTTIKDNNDNDVEVSKEELARKRQSARAAQNRLRVPDSDGLSALSALCAFEASGEDEAFCRTHHLHYRNLREAAALRRQLAKIVEQQQQQLGDDGGSTSTAVVVSLQEAPASPPPVSVLQVLRRALAAGWADQVARRVRSLEYIHRSSKANDGGYEGHIKRKARAVRYRSCALDEDVFLHPNSALHATSPEFIVYTELVRTVKRPYMAGVTAIEPQWLSTVAKPLCTFSEPLIDPPPYYEAAADTVMAWRDVTYGCLNWPLPRCVAGHPMDVERSAFFAAAFLDGQVYPIMKELRSVLAMAPAMAAKPEMRMHKRVADLINTLKSDNVDSKRSLAARWAQEPNFLKNEIRHWIQKGRDAVVDVLWPKLLQEALNT